MFCIKKRQNIFKQPMMIFLYFNHNCLKRLFSHMRKNNIYLSPLTSLSVRCPAYWLEIETFYSKRPTSAIWRKCTQQANKPPIYVVCFDWQSRHSAPSVPQDQHQTMRRHYHDTYLNEIVLMHQCAF